MLEKFTGRLILDDKMHENKQPIYLDYQATTKLDEKVLQSMLPYFRQCSNPHSRSHSYGWIAEEGVEKARKQIATVINANAKDIVFTSGATEASNLALRGCACFYRETGKNHLITLTTEHKCVIDVCRNLESEGFRITYLPVQQNGLIKLQDLQEAITEKTILVSVMAANNEIGVIQPLQEIGKICRQHNVFFHTDAAQAFTKIPLDVEDMHIDLLSISGHKIYGPGGIGALYTRRKNPRIRLKPLFYGGGQERGIRSGTVPTALAVGLGYAAEIASQEMEQENIRLCELRDLLYYGIKKGLPNGYDIVLNGDYEQRLAGNLNISFPYIEGESLLMAIKELAVSSGSACTSASLEPSYVLRALGAGHDLEHSSIRFGLGRFTTRAEIEFAIKLITSKVQKLLDMSPLWEMAQQGIDLAKVNWDAH